MHTLILYLYMSAKYSISYEFKGVYMFSYLCLHVLWGKMCVREAPDPANSQGLVEDDSSETWTSWLSTCSPAQRTLLTACVVRKVYKQSQSETTCCNDDLESRSDTERFCPGENGPALRTFVRLLGVSGREVPSPDCLSPGVNLIPASSIGSARRPMRIRLLM